MIAFDLNYFVIDLRIVPGQIGVRGIQVKAHGVLVLFVGTFCRNVPL